MTAGDPNQPVSPSDRVLQAASAPAPPVSPAPPAARSPVSAWLLALLLAAVTLILYWPATHCEFVNYDDPDYVTANTHVQTGLTWANLKWAFCTPVMGNWHPLTMLSHQLDCQLFGLNPWGHHLTSVLLHALNTALVFLLLHRLTGAVWRSVLVAVLFGWHPLNVESVVWVAERKTVLSTGFGLLALLFYVEQFKTHGPKSAACYGLSLLALALGLLGKPILVTWPFVLLLLDYWPLGRFQSGRVRSLVWEKIPFFALAAAASAVTLLAHQQAGDLMAVNHLSLEGRAENALISYIRYLGKLFWPADLAVYYPHPGDWPPEQVLPAGLLLAGLSWLGWVNRGRHPFLLTGWLWFVGTLVPVIGLVQVGGQSMADRHAYLPSVGMLWLAVWGVYEITRRWRHPEKILSVAGLAVGLCCLVLTRQQLGYWQNSETLFRHALAVTENNHVALDNLGDALFRQGRLDEAISQFQAALRLTPDYATAHCNLGVALLSRGRTDDAISEFQAALRLQPDYPAARDSLGMALLKQGRTGDAIRQLQTGVSPQNDDAETHNRLGIALARQGQMDDAIREFQQAIRLKPEDAGIRNNLGIAFARQSRLDEAISQFQEVIRLNPNDATARNNLKRAMELKNRPGALQ